MALPKRSSPSPPLNSSSSRDLKQRVIICLNKLADRDTYNLAINELEQIARDLNQDSFSPFLSCIYYIDPSQKSPVRKQCARLLGFLSEIHGDDLSPFLSKMVTNIVRRLRDSDTSVRSACIESISTMSSNITKPPFSVFLKPLMEAVLLEQDHNSQIGSSLCLGSAIEASTDPEVAQLLQRFVPRLLKLLKTDGFKAKPALLSLIGSIVGAGAASSQNMLSSLVSAVVEFLSSEDWAARKAAADFFEKLAAVERDSVSEFKSSLLPTFESRRFDKVKIVRESMNRMLEAWKDVPDVSNEVTPPAESKSSSKENASDGRYSSGTKSSSTKLRSSAVNGRQKSPLKGNDSKSTPAMFRKLNRNKPPNWKVEIASPHTAPFTGGRGDDLQRGDEKISEFGDYENNPHHKGETKRSLFSRNSEDKIHKLGGVKSGSRVVPVHHDESLESTVVVSNTAEDLYMNHKNSEDLSLIRMQLLQIENQQSSLLDLLQKFMGSSQNGMRSLETRVHGLEMALDEISYDLAVTTGRISNPETGVNTCCKLPGADFLSSKFWRKAEGRYSTSRFLSSMASPPRVVLHNMGDTGGSAEPFKLENRRFRSQGGGFVVNPLARESSEAHVSSLPKKNTHDYDGRQAHHAIRQTVASAVLGQTGTTSRLLT